MKKENKIKNDLNNDTSVWWLRSTNSYNVGSVASVSYNRCVRDTYYDTEIGVAPSFIV